MFGAWNGCIEERVPRSSGALIAGLWRSIFRPRMAASSNSTASFAERCSRAIADTPKPYCFDCTHAQNEYANKGIRMSMDATGEDSTNPDRVRDGTHIYNMGLPATDVEYGKRNAYGQRVVSRSRPVANNEIASARRARELAKRANLTPLETQKRALGGRS